MDGQPKCMLLICKILDLSVVLQESLTLHTRDGCSTCAAVCSHFSAHCYCKLCECAIMPKCWSHWVLLEATFGCWQAEMLDCRFVPILCCRWCSFQSMINSVLMLFRGWRQSLEWFLLALTDYNYCKLVFKLSMLSSRLWYHVGPQIQRRRFPCIELGVAPLGSTAQLSTSYASANLIAGWADGYAVGEMERDPWSPSWQAPVVVIHLDSLVVHRVVFFVCV
jgi:hypothetical protein